MANDSLRYDCMVEDALRGVVRDALSYVAEQGLPGNHHFYITFRTAHPGVVMPDHLRAQFPKEMTIVLQYQFWGLDVGRDTFGITLSFSDVSERLTIPFESIVAFADPSVRFGLHFDSSAKEEDANQSREGSTGSALRVTQREDPSDGDQESAAEVEDTGKVVPLNTFRKKPGG